MGGPNNKDYSILGSTLGSPDLGKTTIYPMPKTPLSKSRKLLFGGPLSFLQGQTEKTTLGERGHTDVESGLGFRV